MPPPLPDPVRLFGIEQDWKHRQEIHPHYEFIMNPRIVTETRA